MRQEHIPFHSGVVATSCRQTLSALTYAVSVHTRAKVAHFTERETAPTEPIAVGTTIPESITTDGTEETGSDAGKADEELVSDEDTCYLQRSCGSSQPKQIGPATSDSTDEGR